jgi:hypothetical protein
MLQVGATRINNQPTKSLNFHHLTRKQTEAGYIFKKPSRGSAFSCKTILSILLSELFKSYE